jgi:hypothetical protein
LSQKLYPLRLALEQPSQGIVSILLNFLEQLLRATPVCRHGVTVKKDVVTVPTSFPEMAGGLVNLRRGDPRIQV